jgi:hypothetical protein
MRKAKAGGGKGTTGTVVKTTLKPVFGAGRMKARGSKRGGRGR